MSRDNHACKFCLLQHHSVPIITHHADFEGIEQVKGQSGHQVDDEPRGQVMNADLPGIENHLARLADIRGAEIKNNICTREKENKKQKKVGVWLL